jgi:maltose/moltooligosaccharide transporter
MSSIPSLKTQQLWNISFGFFGVQIAYALQSANISRIFATLGADPHNLSYFWILPPLMGIIIQPIIGVLSDKTWCRFGRRIPYLFVGAAVAVLVMCLLPNAGSFGLTVSAAMTFGLLSLMFLDTSINIAMQPFKMLVGDMVNEQQKTKAYSIQSFLCNAGSVMGFVFPFLFTWIGISNTSSDGAVPDSVIYSFYVGAAILILCVIYTVIKVREYPPALYNEYHGLKEKSKESSPNIIKLLMNAPKAFWTVGLVQFFCWAAFMYMWTYTSGAIADNCWGTTDTASKEYQEAGNWVGVLFAIQSVGSVAWAAFLPKLAEITNRKTAYSLSLALGGTGFASVMFFTDQYLVSISFVLIGCAWAAMLAMPFTILTNALEGYGNMGAYLGLFNGTICIPQIAAALAGGVLLNLVGGKQVSMLTAAGISLILGALCVFVIKEKNGKKQ